jgi:hypothetical protein
MAFLDYFKKFTNPTPIENYLTPEAQLRTLEKFGSQSTYTPTSGAFQLPSAPTQPLTTPTPAASPVQGASYSSTFSAPKPVAPTVSPVNQEVEAARQRLAGATQAPGGSMQTVVAEGVGPANPSGGTQKKSATQSPYQTTGTMEGDIAAGLIQGPNIPDDETNALILKTAEDAANNANLRTVTAGGMLDGQKSKSQELWEKIINYYLGYDVSPEAQRIADIRKQLGKIQGAMDKSMADLYNTPGLTMFQNARRQQAINQSSGMLTAPLTSELQALTGLQSEQNQRMSALTNIAQALTPNAVGSPILDEQGNATIVTQDPMTGGYTTLNLGRLGSAKPASTEIAEFEYAVKQGFKGNFLQYLAAKTQATTKSTAGGTGDIAGLAQAVLDNPALYNQLTPTMKGKLAPILYGAGFSDFGKMMSDSALGKVTDIQTAVSELQQLSVEAGSLDAYTGPGASILAMLPGTQTQKYKSSVDRVRQIVGKALEGGVLRKEDEEKYKAILPTVSDTAAVAAYKIQQIMEQMTGDLTRYISNQAAAGRATGGIDQYQVGSIYDFNGLQYKYIGNDNWEGPIN